MAKCLRISIIITETLYRDHIMYDLILLRVKYIPTKCQTDFRIVIQCSHIMSGYEI